MVYTVSIAVPFEDWTRDDEQAIMNELKKFNVESYILTPSGPNNNKIGQIISFSDLIMVIYDKRSFNSDMIQNVIDIAVKGGKRTIVIKERGIPLRGRVINVDVIEYDPEQPDQAVGHLIQYIRNVKAERDAKLGKQVVGWTLGLALAAGLGYLFYKILKE